MAEILPAIIPKNFEDLEEKIGLVEGIARTVHLDIVNGTLTSQTAWPYNGLDKRFDLIKNEEGGLPYWENTDFEAHLMVAQPERIALDWIRAGVKRLIVHAEINPTNLYAAIDLAQEFDIEIGLAVNLETKIQDIYTHIGEVDFLHLMSIAKIGAQGAPFEKRIFDRIEEIQKFFPEKIISVDGGVNLDNADDLLHAGAERLIVGSAIYKSEYPQDTLEDLIALTNVNHGR